MAGESETQTENTGSNGVKGHEADRAAFIAGELGDDKDEGRKETPADDDSDLDDEDEDHDQVDDDQDEDDESDADEDEDEDDDEDKDLDEDDEEEDDDKDVDAETSKRLSQVRRTDQRLRERREQDFAKREAALDARESEIAEHLKPHLEKLDKFEKASARVAVDPAGVLIALGLPEDRYEQAAQVLYTLAKAKDDPKARVAAAQLKKELERDAEIESLKKENAERKEREQERERTSAADRQLDAFFGKVVKAATDDKTPLAKAYIKANPTESRERMQIIAFRLAKEKGTGELPKEREVIIALEKDRRRVLRELGIDPKSKRAAAASAEITDSKKKNASKNGDKTTAKKKKADVDDDKPLTKAEFIRASRDKNYD